MRATPGAFCSSKLVPEQIMTVRDYILRRLNQGETDLKVLARQTRIQFPSYSISFSYIRRIRNEWERASASTPSEGETLSEREPSYVSFGESHGRMRHLMLR